MKISVCGKGGSGKSTVATLLALSALSKGFKTLVIDSDESNSGLYRMLGFDAPPSPLMDLLGGKRGVKQRMGQKDILSQTLIPIEEIPADHAARKDGLILMSIGKILQAFEGCACPMGVLSREFLKKLKLERNEIAIIDMEAGVEHFGRGIDESVDWILLVVEPSYESVALANKVFSISSVMQKKLRAVLNKIDSKEVELFLTRRLTDSGIEVGGVIPNDPDVFRKCLDGSPLGRGKAFEAADLVLGSLLS
jgi:CO dehydrogenase maturation factor